MVKVIMMVGLSGSGKSHKTAFLSEKNNAVIISSDGIRKELFGDENNQNNNEKVFNEVHKRMRECITRGENVIIDATNLTMKNRRQTIEHIKNLKIPCEITAYVMTKKFEACVANDRNRSRTVGREVIARQREKFQLPFYEEGIDKIILENYSKRDNTSQENFETMIYSMENFDQKNKHHKYDLFTHCYKTYELLEEANADPSLKVAGLLHDIGKMETQKVQADGNCSYKFHANVGAYNLLSELKLDVPNPFNRLLEVLFYINYHMLPMDWKEEPTKEKYANFFGQEKYNNLLLFHNCDKKASGTVSE